MPEDDSGDKNTPSAFKTPFQGIGAEGVSTLAARILLTLFPPNVPMFKLMINDAELQDANEAAQEVSSKQKAWETEVQTALSRFEQIVQADIEASGDRPNMHEGLLHLITVGNVLLYDAKDVGQGIRVFPLSRYVVSRDPLGRWLEIVVHEKVSLKALPAYVQQSIMDAVQSGGTEVNPNDETYLDLYTHVRRNGETCTSYQEVAGQVIAGSEGEYPLKGCPFIPLRMYWVAGEDYGRSYVENFLGDLKSLEALTQAIVEASAISAKVVFAVNPNSTLKAADLAKAPNGGFVTGPAKDVEAVQVNKTTDLRVALETAQMLHARLSKAFMLMDSIRRDAERVTAEEIRALASEMEAGHGGLYSMLSQELQLPYVWRRIHRLTKAGKLDSLPKGAVEPTIVTGFEALGRGNDKAKLISYITTVGQALGPQVIQQYLNVPDFLERLAASDGINTKGLIKSAEELQAEAEQAKQMQLAQSLGPKALDMVGKAAGSQQQSQPQQTPAPAMAGG